MKATIHTSILASIFALPVAADVIYSNLQDIAIPKNNDGVYLNIFSGQTDASPFTGWHINPTNGGIYIYNNTEFQPLRETNSDDGTVSNISLGGLIDSSSSYYASQMGVSFDHLGNELGNTFTPGTEGYLGFSVVNGASTNYGWMRVVLTGTGTPLIKDWSYDTSGTGIIAGGVRQVGQDIILASQFTLGSALGNSGGATNLLKNSEGKTTLTATNTHTGITHVSSGTLAVNGSGSINSNSNLVIDGGEFSYNSSVNYTQSVTFTSGIIGGSNLNGGLNGLVIGAGQTLSPSDSVGTAYTGSQTWTSGGTYLFEIQDAAGNAGSAAGWDLLSGTGSLNITADAESRFTIAMRTLGISGSEGNPSNFDEMTDFSWLIADFASSITGYNEDSFALDSTEFTQNFTGMFSVVLGSTVEGGDDSQIYLNYYAIPEPRTALLLLLSISIMFKRHRQTPSSGRPI